jgi:hypothetical protein
MQSLAVDTTSLLLAVHVAMHADAAKHYELSTAAQPAMTMCEASIDRQARRRTPHTNCATRERVKLVDGANALPSVQDFCSVCRKSK